VIPASELENWQKAAATCRRMGEGRVAKGHDGKALLQLRVN